MEWIKYTINTTADAEELITASLNEIGISGVEIEDKRPVDAAAQAGLFGEVIPEMPEDDQLARISFYLDSAEDQEAVLSRVRESLEELRAFADIGGSVLNFGNALNDRIHRYFSSSTCHYSPPFFTLQARESVVL